VEGAEQARRFLDQSRCACEQETATDHRPRRQLGRPLQQRCGEALQQLQESGPAAWSANAPPLEERSGGRPVCRSGIAQLKAGARHGPGSRRLKLPRRDQAAVLLAPGGEPRRLAAWETAEPCCPQARGIGPAPCSAPGAARRPVSWRATTHSLRPACLAICLRFKRGAGGPSHKDDGAESGPVPVLRQPRPAPGPACRRWPPVCEMTASCWRSPPACGADPTHPALR